MKTKIKKMKKQKKGYLTTPTEESAKKAVIKSGAIALGVMLSRGLITLLPDNMEKYAKALIALGGIGLSASSSQLEMQLAGAGISALQITELIKDSVSKTQINNEFLATTLGVGSKTSIEPVKRMMLNGSKLGNPFKQKVNWDSVSEDIATENPQYFS